MRLIFQDYAAKSCSLNTIYIQDDFLAWKYKTAFFLQDCSIPISSIASVSLADGQLTWQYSMPIHEKSTFLSETLSARSQTLSEQKFLAGLYQDLLAKLVQRENASRGGSRDHASSDSSRQKQQHRGGNSDQQRSSRSQDQTSEQSADTGRSSQRSRESKAGSRQSCQRSSEFSHDIRGALLTLGSSLSGDQKRRLKATLRMVHHPDHGGSKDYFIALEIALRELQW
jgi:hypothetical protein